MKKIDNYDEIVAATKPQRLPAGAYLCYILDVEDVPLDPKTGRGDFLKIKYDVLEGEYKGIFTKRENEGGYAQYFYRSYKESALPMFKHFISKVEKSNKNFTFDFDETKLKGKIVGLVIAEEEYEKKDGSVGTRYYISDVLDTDELDAKQYRVPPLKKLSRTAQAVPVPPPTDEDLPF